ncbi:hypothetical protein K488DRAFT_58997 [Vararia minispora EC-137]|uniref:Uncharacterized protein n=1 Tax=Vararia minispora EC-137 TaxID=1314806 RepID=A0ACB8Q9D2_9AGAM|nr:hypothetical protein K488DRAFT_58997 [Vararia minispora EC-137]
MDVSLSDVEVQLCDLLDECTQYLEKEKGIRTACRIAGGWVRDKLLGSDSHDIDVALEDMMGHPFALEFTEYASSAKNLEVKAVSKVKGNPDQSKHLETAKTSVFGLDLDFVNLRAEEYADNSRIPTTVTFGTPLEDALRRDTTINSLFYNVHTRSVEDHVGTGLEDLKKGIIRTPLPPRQTFMDDPLRVIRCVRFASRFGFEMVPELVECAREPEIQEALVKKITRERVGEEVDKMMNGMNPLHSIYLIHTLRLFSPVFYTPEAIQAKLSSSPGPSSSAVAAASLLHTFTNAHSPRFQHPPLHPLLTSAISPSTSARLFLACALTPYAGITYPDRKGIKPAVEAAVREGLKCGTRNHYLDGIPALFQAAAKLCSPHLASQKSAELPERVVIGLLLRDPAVHNPLVESHWTSSLLFSLVQELVQFYDGEKDSFDVQAAAACIENYNGFVRRIQELDLVSAADAKPLLDGREILQVLGATKPGVWTGKVLTDVVQWQLGHPEGTKEQCMTWVQAQGAAGRWAAEMAQTQHAGSAKRIKKADGDVATKKKR